MAKNAQKTAKIAKQFAEIAKYWPKMANIGQKWLKLPNPKNCPKSPKITSKNGQNQSKQPQKSAIIAIFFILLPKLQQQKNIQCFQKKKWTKLPKIQ